MTDQFKPNPPDLYQGLTTQYWLKKWLPDPSPDALDELMLAQSYHWLTAIRDDGLRKRAQAALGELLAERLLIQ